MSMQVFSARVQNGAIVPEDGVTLPEGSKVTVIADGEEQAFEATAEEESELLEAIAGVERGETVRAEDLLTRLRR
jgi:predicted DNA-binding antitoxin AbrB/MazE fold protein